jgi:ClpP class serine protease
MLAFDAALNSIWAMEPDALDRLLEIASRVNEVSPEALEAYRAENLKRAERAKNRDGVAIIEAHGPLFKRANLFAAMSGATSYEMMRRDLQTALDDPKVRAIMFSIDSPGGEALGTSELAQAVFDARGKKPIAAYVSGMGASAAYWLASAVDPGNLVIDKSALLGSIGVQMALRESAPKPGEKTYRFVASQSPMKNADPGTEEGAAAIQGVVDSMAQVFVEAVSRNRNVATETVLSDFGKGGIFVGQEAVAAGLADRIGSFESVFAELSAKRTRKAKGATMSDETTFTAAERDAHAASILASEKTRVAGLRRIAAAHKASDSDLNAAIEGTTTVEAFALAQADKAAAAATVAAEAAAVAETARLAALKTDEEAAAQAASKAPPKGEAEEADALVASIAAYAPSARTPAK